MVAATNYINHHWILHKLHIFVVLYSLFTNCFWCLSDYKLLGYYIYNQHEFGSHPGSKRITQNYGSQPTQILNLSSITLTEIQQNVLEKGLSFARFPQSQTWDTSSKEWISFSAILE